MKKTLDLIFSILLLSISACKVHQIQIVPLNKSAFSSSNNTYFKDLDNELEVFTGTWITSFQNRLIN